MASGEKQVLEAILRKLLLECDKELSEITGLKREFLRETEAEKWLIPVINGEAELHYYCDKDSFIIYQKLLKFTYIIKIYVKKSKRRKGIASRLIRDINGPLLLECHPLNISAESCYKKLGFKKLPLKGNNGNNWFFYGEGKEQWLAAVLAQEINHRQTRP